MYFYLLHTNMYFYFYVTVSPHEIGVEVQDHRLHSATKINKDEFFLRFLDSTVCLCLLPFPPFMCV